MGNVKDIHAQAASCARSRPLFPGHLLQARVAPQGTSHASDVLRKGRLELLLHALWQRIGANEDILILGIYLSQGVQEMDQVLTTSACRMAEEHGIDADFHETGTSSEKFVAPLYSFW